MMTDERYSEFQNEIEKFKQIYQGLFKKQQQRVIYNIRKIFLNEQKSAIRNIIHTGIKEVDEWWQSLDNEMKYALTDYWRYTADYEDEIYQSPRRTIHFGRLSDPNCETMQQIKEKNE